MDAAIHELSDTIQEIDKEKKKMRHDEFCEKLFKRGKSGGKMRRQVTKPRHEEEKLSSLPERKMTLRMMQEGRVRYKEWKVHAQVGEKVQEVQKPWRQEELKKQRKALPPMGGQTLKRSAMSLKPNTEFEGTCRMNCAKKFLSRCTMLKCNASTTIFFHIPKT